MGFMFWKQDLDFDLRNHLKTAKLNGRSSEQVEMNLSLFLEELVNKPFVPKRSPWEIFVINNYVNEQLGNREKTLLVFRFHHCLADGYSVVFAIIEGLCGTSLKNIGLALPSKPLEIQSLQKKLQFAIKLPFEFLCEISEYVALISLPSTPFHAYDKDKKGERTLYERCPEPIDVQRVKDIKNKFGVSFTAVLLSAISAGMSKSLDRILINNKNGTKVKALESINLMIPLPLPGHPGKLKNHVTGTYLELPTILELGPVERLQKIEKTLERTRSSILPGLLPWLLKAAGSMFPIMTKVLTENRVMSVGFTNVPAPGAQVYMAGRKGLSAEMFAGTLRGVMGVAFQLLSLRHNLRMAVVAENCVMERSQVNELIENVTKEFVILYALAKK